MRGIDTLFSIEFWASFGEAAKTAAGFFWKSGWAFVLGYFISAMIQAFVPKGRLTPYLGGSDAKSVSLATAFGAISSSCSFAALAAARALVMKGAHFVAAVAFMFASTNLVIELGILILIFLGWQFLAAEIMGGLVLIVISRQLIVWTYPEAWLEKARQKVEEASGSEEEDFDWRKRIRSVEGWRLVGHNFAAEWAMVWEEIAIGFTVAGFVAVLVPETFLAGHLFGREGGREPAVLSVGPGKCASGALRGRGHFYRLYGQHPPGHGAQFQRRAFCRHHGLHLLRPHGTAFGGDQRPLLRLARGALHCRGDVCQHRVHRLDPALFICPVGSDAGKCAGRQGCGPVQAGLYLLDEPGRRRSGRLAVLAEPFLAPSQQRRGTWTWQAGAR